MNIVGIIPARFASTRFPGKPLVEIAGKPLVQWVVEQCQKAKSLSEIIVATDDTRIWEVTQNFCRTEIGRPTPIQAERIGWPRSQNGSSAMRWSIFRAMSH